MISISERFVNACKLPYRWWKRYKFEMRVKDRISKTGREPSPKVFGIGLSRTGTTSLTHALKHLGYKTLHWTHGESGGRVIGWPEFFYADAATDITVSAQFESLYYTFPESKFIYTVRDIDSWRDSIVRHLNGMESPREWHPTRDMNYFQVGRFHSLVNRVQAWQSLYCNCESWEEAYRIFDSRVERFFEAKPDELLLKMDIANGDGWEKLCSFLNHKAPDCSFPHANQSV